MLIRLRQIVIIFTLLLLFKAGIVSAATFYLEPAAGNFIRGCNSTVAIKMNLSGERSNGAQAYVDYSGIPGGSISLGAVACLVLMAIPAVCRPAPWEFLVMAEW